MTTYEPLTEIPGPKRSKGDHTRSAIVREALGVAADVGLEGLSLGALATRLGISKSGLFAHFKSKEDLQLAVIDEATERFANRVVAPALAKPRGEPRVRALFENQLDWTENSGFGTGCFFMALCQEYDDRPGIIRDRVVKSQVDWRDVMAKAVSLSIREGHFGQSVDATQFAFEFVGITNAFQQAHKLLSDAGARARAVNAFERLVVSSRKKRG